MIVKHPWLGSVRGPVRCLAALATAGWLVACMPQAPGDGAGAGTGGTGDRGGSGGSGSGGSGGAGSGGAGSGGAASGGSNGGGGSSSAGGSAGGAGQTGTGGAASPIDASSSGSGGAGAPAGDAGGGDVPPTSPIPGYALCVVCHGPEGAGTMLGPEIQHPVKDFATFVVRNGRTHPGFKDPMPKFTPEQISVAQLDGIFAFLSSRPKPTTGPELYKDYCQNCHGPDAKGGITMRDLSAKTMANFLTDTRAGHHPGEFANRREYMPKWTAAELTDAEIRLIFTHVDGL